MSKAIWYISKYVSPFRPDIVGAGSRGYFLMREFAGAGYKSIIITSDSNPLAGVPNANSPYQKEILEGVCVYWIRTLKYCRAKSIRRILSWVHFEWKLWLMPKRDLPNPDVIIVSSLSLLTILNGMLLRRRFRCRLVFEVRDIWPLTLTEEGGFSRWNPFVLALSIIEKLGYRCSDAIVGTMPNLQEHVENVSGSTKPVYCVPMGINESMLKEQRPVSLGYLKRYIPADKFVVAYAGTVGATNALETFFEAAASLQEEPGIHFVVIGDGDFLEFYQSCYGHLSNLTFAPKVEKLMVQSVLAKCDLLYFSASGSAVWQFGQSLNKVIDYMLSGKPIVASYNGFPSMINESGCGDFVEVGSVSSLTSEIIRIRNLPISSRKKIGENGKSWLLKNRDYSNLAQTYLSILFPGS